MTCASFEQRRRWERLSRPELARHQLSRLNQLLAAVLPSNKFYADKLGGVSPPLRSLEELSLFPDTHKSELVELADGQAGAGTRLLSANATYPAERYLRYHRTSGTHGRPLVVVDTAEDWQWWIDTWQFVLDAAEVTSRDRALMAFSFGPFIGFWSANDALLKRGAMVIPAGGLDSRARLELLQSSGATVVCGTPTYALRLAEVAAEEKIDLASGPVTRIIVAGEPGGSAPATRTRIENAWQARVIDHSGATEVGPWGYADVERRGLHVVETEFIAEFRSLKTGQPAAEGELAELVLTTLGRWGCPVIRYRTGDLVRPTWHVAGTNNFVLLDGGVLGRVDDMLVIRGVNVFPSAVEQIVRSFPEIAEFRITATRHQAMDQLRIEIEDQLQLPQRVAREVKLRLGLSVHVAAVPAGSLPRFEGKAKRFIDLRTRHSENDKRT
jgi:phenylacetate-CoA ligase